MYAKKRSQCGSNFFYAGFETCFGWDPQRLKMLGGKHISNPDFLSAIWIYNMRLTMTIPCQLVDLKKGCALSASILMRSSCQGPNQRCKGPHQRCKGPHQQCSSIKTDNDFFHFHFFFLFKERTKERKKARLKEMACF